MKFQLVDFNGNHTHLARGAAGSETTQSKTSGSNAKEDEAKKGNEDKGGRKEKKKNPNEGGRGGKGGKNPTFNGVQHPRDNSHRYTQCLVFSHADGEENVDRIFVSTLIN